LSVSARPAEGRRRHPRVRWCSRRRRRVGHHWARLLLASRAYWCGVTSEESAIGLQLVSRRRSLSGSSGFCVGAIQFPPLCKGRHGGVDASRGWASREVLGSCKPASFLPPLAPPPDSNNRGEGTPLGTNHVLPSTHTISGRAAYLFIARDLSIQVSQSMHRTRHQEWSVRRQGLDRG